MIIDISLFPYREINNLPFLFSLEECMLVILFNSDAIHVSTSNQAWTQIPLSVIDHSGYSFDINEFVTVGMQ